MIDNWLFKYKKKRLPQREVVFPNYSKVRSVAVVYEQGVDDKGIALLAKRLEKDGIMVEVVGYEPKKDFNWMVVHCGVFIIPIFCKIIFYFIVWIEQFIYYYT